MNELANLFRKFAFYEKAIENYKLAMYLFYEFHF
jgi:hypothetical protein